MPERTPPRLAQDKLAFLLSLVPYLVDRDRVAVADAAAHFGVSPDHVRAAVRLIGVSGVPGETATYQHGDLFDISWDSFENDDEIVLTNRVAIDESPRFSAREASALIAGLQYLSALPENADREAIASLMAKLSQGASATPSRLGVEVSESDASIAVIQESVASGHRLRFDYRTSRGDSEHRTVDPLRVESVNADWYLRGWDHLRGGVRTFRLDRMSALTISDEPIAHTAASISMPDSLFEATDDDLIVTIDVSDAVMPLLVDYRPDVVEPATGSGLVRAKVRVSHYHGLKRLVTRLSGEAVVVEPAEARTVVAEWARSGADRYR